MCYNDSGDNMYEIFRSLNSDTKLAVNESNNIYILKRITLAEVPLVKTLSALDNPHIARCYGTATVDGEFYAVCEHIQGETLADYVRRAGPLEDVKVREIALQLCDGLAAVHGAGIVHRDINPNNIMLDSLGNVKIIDFGISRLVKPNQTMDTEILGTHGYAAPEQYGFEQTSGKSDIYAVGVLMNYLLTGCLPSVRAAAGPLAPVILKCIQIDDTKRYENVHALSAALGKRGRLLKLLRSLPGFRANKPWHKAVAVTYCIAAVFFETCLILAGTSAFERFCYGAFGFFLMFVPVPLLTDYKSWTRRFRLTANMTVRNRRLFQCGCCGLSVLIGMLFIIISPSP